MVVIDETAYLAHYGILRKSGRYPWGSGGTQPARNRMFLDYVENMRSQGLSEVEIAKGVGISTTDLRALKSIAKSQQKQSQINMAQRLKDKGYSNVEIGKRMSLNESSVRALLAPGEKDRADVLQKTANVLKAHVDEKKYVDVGSGVENYLGVSKEKLATALAMLKEQGYTVHTVKSKQVGTGLDTEYKILAPPGTTQREVFLNRGQIQQVVNFSDDGGRSFSKIHDPISISPKRVQVVYKEDGGDKADGIIYVRPGVKDLSIGNERYAQVRVKVGREHYLKGMAIYKDDLPLGVDLQFNTNKSNTGNKLDALKPIKDDLDLPFGSVVRQVLANPGTPKERVTSAMNIVGVKPGSGEEGSWGTWSKNLAPQMLSKQNPALAREQLGITYERRQREFDKIKGLTNPTIKRKLLETFSDEADSAAVHLEAAALPRQSWHVILPVNSLPPGQVYAPNYRNGERVVLIRYPHGGTFEIPEVVVNNKHSESKNLLGAARDAIGINHLVAQRLSGADFDGDTVLVIPNASGKVKSSPALEGLKNFDPQSYKIPADSNIPKISKARMQREMGDVSNLITDMTLRGASHDELARAIRHSMVVIDSEKHGLNYKLSAEVNGIAKLKEEYQGRATAGAKTLISRAKSDQFVLERKPRPQAQGGPINRLTGERVFVETGRTKTSSDGKVIKRTQRSTKLAETSDAFTLSSGTPMEKIYAEHSNKLKSLANQARLASINTPRLQYSPSANKTYATEVKSLDAKLALILRNRPLERQAQIIANQNISARRKANPDLDGDSLKKIKWKAQDEARIRTGAKKNDIVISQKEWDAIQAGAISDHKLGEILKKADLTVVRELATPRANTIMTSNMVSRAKHMLASGYTRAEVADQLGVSLSTIDKSTG